MALRGIQEYVARDANNIAWVEDKAIQYYYYLYRALCVVLLSYDREWLQADILSVYNQRIWSARMCRVIIVGYYSGHISW